MKTNILKIALTVIIIIMISSYSFADINTNYGLKSGISIMKIKSSDTKDSDSIVKPCFGVYLSINYEGGFAIQPELLLTMKGGKTDYSSYGIIAIEEDVYTYLELPLLAKYNINAGNSVRFSVFAGPSIGMLLGTHYKLTGLDADYLAGLLGVSTEGSAKDLGINTNPFEFSLQFGIGTSYKLMTGEINLDVRYCIGLTNVIKSTLDYDNKNSGMVVMIGYTF